MSNEVEFALFLPNSTFVRFADTLLYKNIAEPHVALFPINVQFSMMLFSNNTPSFERKQTAPPIKGAVLLMKFEFIIVVFNALSQATVPLSSVLRLMRTAPPDFTF